MNNVYCTSNLQVALSRNKQLFQDNGYHAYNIWGNKNEAPFAVQLEFIEWRKKQGEDENK